MKHVIRLSLSIVLLVLSLPLSARAESPEEHNTRVLLISQEAPGYPQALNEYALLIEMLLRHFTPETTRIGESLYETGQLFGYDRVVVIGTDADAALSPVLLQDLVHAGRPVLWLGYGLNQLPLDLDAAYGFSVSACGEKKLPEQVEYRGQRYAASLAGYCQIHLAAQSVEILSTFVGDEEPVPYIVRDANLWYVNGLPEIASDYPDPKSDAPILIVADALHDFFGTSVPYAPQALIRLEDVSVHIAPDRIRETVDFLDSEKIPFALGLIPSQRLLDGRVLKMRDRPDFIRSIRYAQNHGGTIILHGYNHTFGSGEDYEFWDPVRNAPLADESWEKYAAKVEDGIRILRNYGIEPQLWETPHYAGSSLAYRVFAHYFSHAIENRSPISWLPYPGGPDIYGQMNIPETLGYISPAEEQTVEDMLERARLLRIVRDGWAVGYYHPASIPLSDLKALAAGLRQLDYTFVDLQTLPLEITHEYRPSWWIRFRTALIIEPGLQLLELHRLLEQRLDWWPVARRLPWSYALVVGVSVLFVLRLRKQWQPSTISARSLVETNTQAKRIWWYRFALGGTLVMLTGVGVFFIGSRTFSQGKTDRFVQNENYYHMSQESEASDTISPDTNLGDIQLQPAIPKENALKSEEPHSGGSENSPEANAVQTGPTIPTPPAGQLYHGVFSGNMTDPGDEGTISLNDLRSYEQTVGKPAAWVYFSHEWNQDEFGGRSFPITTTTQIRDTGSIPFIRLMLRTSPELDIEEPTFSLQRIIEGEFDADLHSWARAARNFGTPLLVEYGTEVNGEWFSWNGIWNGGEKLNGYGNANYPDGPERFRDAYRHIIEIARQEGASNIAWVFHVNYQDSPQEQWNRLEYYYPGDDWIDWIGISAYGADSPTYSQCPSLREALDTVYPRLISLAPDKPIALLEFGSAESSQACDQAVWAEAALRDLVESRWPRIIGFAWWNNNWANDDDPSHDTYMRVQDNPDLVAVFQKWIGSAPNVLGRVLPGPNPTIVDEQDDTILLSGVSGGWDLYVYYTVVESFYSGLRQEIFGCSEPDCEMGETFLGDYPYDFVLAVHEEGTGRITRGRNAGRYLNWSPETGYWLDTAQRDDQGRPLEPYVSATAHPTFPYGTKFGVLNCGEDKVTETPLEPAICEKISSANWIVSDHHEEGTNPKQIILYVGEQDRPNFMETSPNIVATNGALLSMGSHLSQIDTP